MKSTLKRKLVPNNVCSAFGPSPSRHFIPSESKWMNGEGLEETKLIIRPSFVDGYSTRFKNRIKTFYRLIFQHFFQECDGIWGRNERNSIPNTLQRKQLQESFSLTTGLYVLQSSTRFLNKKTPWWIKQGLSFSQNILVFC